MVKQGSQIIADWSLLHMNGTKKKEIIKLYYLILKIRNRSAEFGYYLPLNKREEGYVIIMSNLS